MFSIQKLLGKEDKLFTLLEASAEEVCSTVRAFTNVSGELARHPQNEECGYARHRDRQLTKEINAAVYTSFTTSLQREDIQALSDALYRITKTVDKFTERAQVAPRYVQGVDFSPQLALLQSASEIVRQLVKSLRAGMNARQIKELVEQLRFNESAADKLMPGLYQQLFSGKYEAVQAIFLKDLYELLEKAIDCCRTAGNIISRIVLKNS